MFVMQPDGTLRYVLSLRGEHGNTKKERLVARDADGNPRLIQNPRLTHRWTKKQYRSL